MTKCPDSSPLPPRETGIWRILQGFAAEDCGFARTIEIEESRSSTYTYCSKHSIDATYGFKPARGRAGAAQTSAASAARLVRFESGVPPQDSAPPAHTRPIY